MLDMSEDIGIATEQEITFSIYVNKCGLFPIVYCKFIDEFDSQNILARLIFFF